MQNIDYVRLLFILGQGHRQLGKVKCCMYSYNIIPNNTRQKHLATYGLEFHFCEHRVKVAGDI